METIATIPPPHREEAVLKIARHPNVDAVRFNVGARTRVSPLETCMNLLELCVDKPLWLDLKGRQLRITRWADLEFDPIQLNHRISVDSPATIILRNGTDEGVRLPIERVSGHKVYVDSSERFVVGEGQSVNIHGDDLEIEGYLTETDEAYIDAAQQLGLKNFMLSFVERETDICRIKELIPDANLVLKIETRKGLELINDPSTAFLHSGTHLMVARDDLMTNLSSPEEILDVTRRMLEMDTQAIVASRILTSLIKSERASLGDLVDLEFLKVAGCSRIMLCDDLCTSEGFDDAMKILKRWGNADESSRDTAGVW